MNSTLKVLNNRVSLRRFSSQPIAEQDMEAILQAAMRAPTAGNQMLYSIIRIQDQERKDQLAELSNHQKFIASAPTVLVFLADQHKWYEYYRLSHVPEYVTSEGIGWHNPTYSDLLLAFEDTMIAAHNAVIAAESLGIGSCYIGSALMNGRELAQLLNLPEYVVPLAVVPMGYYPEGFKKVRSERFEKQYVVFDEQYRQFGAYDLERMFEKHSEKYSSTVGNNSAPNFAQAFYKRKTGAAFMKQMANSLKQLLSVWE